MKAYLLSCTAALLSTLPLHADTPAEPIIDGVPLQSNRQAELEQKVKELEKRLEAA